MFVLHIAFAALTISAIVLAAVYISCPVTDCNCCNIYATNRSNAPLCCSFNVEHEMHLQQVALQFMHA